MRAEAELLCICARTHIVADDAMRARQLSGMVDWERLLKLALRHGVLPLLSQQLNATCADLLPADVSARLHDLFYANAARNQRLTAELCRLLELFAAHAVKAIPYKGPVLALQAYGDLALRQFNDLDVLIRREDVPRVVALLRAEGYRQQWQLTRAQEAAYLRTDCERLFTHEQARIFLDVHWAFVRSYFPVKLAPEAFWARTETLALDGTTVASFAPEDLLVILCVHAGKDLWARLVWVCDVAELIRACPQLDWSRVTQTATTAGVRRMLNLGLLLAHQLLNIELPADIQRHVQADQTIKRLSQQVRERMFRDEDDSISALTECLFHFRLQARLRDKARYTLRYTLTTNPADWAFLSIPDQLFFLYRALRPLRLLSKRR